MPDEPFSNADEELRAVEPAAGTTFQLAHIAGSIGRVAEKTERLEAQVKNVEDEQLKHSFALFGFEGGLGLVAQFGKLREDVEQIDEKIDAVNASIEEKFSKLMRYALASIVTFCLTVLPVLIVILVASGNKP